MRATLPERFVRLPVRRCARGFTLIELMTVLVILVIFITVAFPSFQQAILSSRLSSYSNSLVASVYLARSEAMKRNKEVTLCASDDGEECGASSGDWRQGWIVIDEDTGDVLQYQQGLPDGFKISSSGGQELTFQPTGVGATASTLLVCRYAPSAGNQEREITVSPTGKPSLERTETGTCP